MKKKADTKPIRKVTDGAIRNKERTMQKMIHAVGEVLKEKGYSGLTAKNIINKAEVDRKLIADYFGNLNNLIEAYIASNDYWMAKVAPKLQTIVSGSERFASDEIISILHLMFDEVNTSADLRSILIWEISEYQEKLRQLADNREALGTELFKITDKDFSGTDIDQRAILALQIAGIYYLILHAKACGSTFCEIDISTLEGKNAIKKALEKLVTLMYNSAKDQQSTN
ncbi:hypothetical protein D3C71_89280 [compost metagenome]